MSLGIMAHYGGGSEAQWFKAAWARTGKKLDMGACCIRFKRLEDLPLDLIGEAIRRIPARKFIEHFELLAKSASKRGSKSSAERKAARKKPTATKKAIRKAGARR
jgi:hypothetical protein